MFGGDGNDELAGGRNNDVALRRQRQRPRSPAATTSTGSTAATATTACGPGWDAPGEFVDCGRRAMTGRSWARVIARRTASGSRATATSDTLFGMSTTVPSALPRPTPISYDDLYARWERGNWRATEIDFSPGRRRLEREAHARAAAQRAVALHAVLPRRGLGHRQPLALHRRRAAGGAEVLPRPPSRSTRRVTRSSSTASCTRSSARRRHDRPSALRATDARDHVGAPQGLRAAWTEMADELRADRSQAAAGARRSRSTTSSSRPRWPSRAST